MKPLLPIVILFLFGVTSCSKGLDINGTWLSTYYSDETSQIQNIDIESRLFLSIKKSKIRIKEFPNEYNDFNQFDTLVDYKLSNNKIIFKDKSGKIDGPFLVSKDSIIAYLGNGSKSYAVFKKLP